MTYLHKLVLVLLWVIVPFMAHASSSSPPLSCPTDSLQISLQSPNLCSRAPIEFQSNLLNTDLVWDYGDGTVDNGLTNGHATHIYLEPGDYTVSVTADYGGDCFETETITIQVLTNEVDFTYQVINKTVTFTAIPNPYSAIERYSWNLGDGALASGLTTNLEYTYLRNGEYTVTLIGEGPCATTPIIKTIMVGTPPSPEDSPAACTDGLDNDGDGLIDCEDTECECICTSGSFGCCDDFTAEFNILHATPGESDGVITIIPSGGSGKAENYQVIWGITPAPNGLEASNLAPGNYQVELTDIAYGCSLSFNLTVTEDNCRTIEMTSTVDVLGVSICDNNNGIASVQHTGGTPPFTYLWSDASTGTTAINLASGTQSVTVTDASGCVNIQEFEMGSTAQEVNAQFLYEITSDSILFTNISTGPVNGNQWTFNTPDPIRNNRMPLPPAGNYEICLIVENDCGSSNQACQTIGIAPECASEVLAINVLDGQLNYCTRQPVFLSTNVSAEKYTWFFGDINAFTGAESTTSGSALSNTSHLYFQATDPEVKLIVDYGNGCIDSTSIQLKIQSSEADFSYSITDGIGQFIADTSAYISNYTWSFAGPTTSANAYGRIVDFSFPESGEYTVTLMPTGECEATITQKIIIAQTNNTPENTPRACSDGLDNDGDGLLDCEDSDCVCPDCPTDLILEGQIDIDNFPISYPTCTEIPGDVIIQSIEEDINNLDALNQITSIGGNLIIVENPALENLSGLDKLEYIGGDFEIDQNPLITNLHALSDLISIGGTFAVGEQINLSQLFNPSNNQLNSIGGDLLIYEETWLANLHSLEGLSSIGGSLEIANQTILLSLEGLDNITSLGGSLLLSSNAQLNTLSALIILGSIDGEILITDNPNLTTLSGIDNIRTSGISKISLQSSTSLSYCAVKSVCNFIAAEGNIKVLNNATGCETPQEVATACLGTTPTLPEIFVDYPWLTDHVNPNDCSDEQITEYKTVNGSTYLLVTTSTSSITYNTFGQVWCTSTATYNCQSFYVIDEVIRVWNCDGATFIDQDEDGTPLPDDPDDNDPCIPDNTVANCDTNVVVERPTIFVEYPWLTDLVDVNDCEGVSILAYQSGSYTYVLVETPSSSILYNGQGALYCTNGPGLNCLDYYMVSDTLNTWQCGPSPIDADMDGTIAIDDPDDNDPCVPNNTVANCNVTIVDADQDGTPAADDPDDNDPCVPDNTAANCNNNGGNVTPAFFDDYPWLNDLVDVNDCEGTSILVYRSGSYIYVLVESPTSSILYNGQGSLYCTNGHGLNCLDYYTVSEELHNWTCGANPTPVDADQDGTPAANDPDDNDPCVPDNTVANCNVIIVDVDQDGTPAADDPDDNDPCVPDNSVANCNTNSGNETPAFFDDYPWLNDLVDVNDCEGTSILVYRSGSYTYVLVDSPTSSIVYNGQGGLYCTNGPGLNCLDYYTVSEELHNWTCGSNPTPVDADQDGTPAENDPDDNDPCVPDNTVANCNVTIVDADQDGTPAADDPDDNDPCVPDNSVANCNTSGGNETPAFFDDYQWLNDLVDVNDCEGTSILVYRSGSYTYVLVDSPTSSILYNGQGGLYCTNGPGLNCLDYYTVSEELHNWTCGANPTPVDADQDGTPATNDPDDNDPCVPDNTVANCNVTVVDADQDGTPAADDPDDNDPCVPDNSVANCNTSGGNEAPAFFDDYPWLNDIVDVNDYEGTSILVYRSGSYTYVLVESPTSSILYNGQGSLYCTNSPGLNCLDYYTVSEELHNWTCGATPTPVDADQDGTPATNDPDDNDPCVPDNTVANCNVTIVDADQDGTPATEDPDDNDACVPDNTVSNCVTNSEIPAFFEEYTWLNNFVDPTACNGDSITIYKSGGYTYLLLTKGTSSILYNAQGTEYCVGSPIYICTDLYVVDEVVETWKCSTTTPYVPTGDCNNFTGNVRRINCSDGTPFIFIELPNGTIYDPYFPEGMVFDFEDGTTINFDFVWADFWSPCNFVQGTIVLTCVSASESCICPDTELPVCGVDGNTYKNECEATCAGIEVISPTECGSTVPNFYSSFPWLADLFDTDTCVNETITVYRSSLYTGYKYVVLQGPGWTELYFQDGTLFCQSTPDYDCIVEYALVEAEHVWVCPSSSLNAPSANRIANTTTTAYKDATKQHASARNQRNLAIDDLSNNIILPEKEISDFTLFPNPTSGNSFIKIAASTQAKSLQVRSITGTVILEMTIDSRGGEQIIPLNLNGVLPGIYMVQVKQKAGMLTKRLVVN